MTNVSGNFKNVSIWRGSLCPDFSTGNSITLEEFLQKTLEKELQFQHSIVEENIIRENLDSDPFEEWFHRAKWRINKLCGSHQKFGLNEVVRGNALYAVAIFQKYRILPSLINPTEDESLLLEFFVGEKYFSIDFYNSGEIVYLHKGETLPTHVIELNIEDIPDVATEILRAQTRCNL